jgi:hypothetical protein
VLKARTGRLDVLGLAFVRHDRIDARIRERFEDVQAVPVMQLPAHSNPISKS